MTESSRPVLLQLADALEKDVWEATPMRLSAVVEQAAQELRTHHSRITALEASHLEELRAYELTVSNLRAELESLRNGQCLHKIAEPAAPQAVQAATPTDYELRLMWITAGGDFFGPKTVTGSMPESKLLQLLRRFATHPTPQGLEPDMFWDAACPEDGDVGSIHNVLNERYSNDCLEVGQEIEIMQAHKLPNITVRVTAAPNDDSDDIGWEVVDAAQAKQGLDAQDSWTDLKIAFDIPGDEVESLWLAVETGGIKLPNGWTLAETTGSGCAGYVAIFRVDHLPTSGETFAVSALIAAQAKQTEALQAARSGGCGCCGNACADRNDGCRFVHENLSDADMAAAQAKQGA